jgi:hypothetical protein
MQCSRLKFVIGKLSNYRTMKTIQLTTLLLISPLIFFAQSLTGLWVGAVSNDSTTIRKDQSFEIVLTQYKDKVYGYSRSAFIVNDSLFYIVKRVKGTIEGDICEVKDDEIVSYNFHGRLNKGVKMISTFRLDHEDGAWKMDGQWKTNQTKKYYPLSGKIGLKEEKNYEQSKIFPHLEELKLADDVAFYKESKKTQEQVAAIKQPIKDKQEDQTVKKEIISPAVTKETKTEVAAVPAKQKLQKPDQVVITKPVEEKKEVAKETAEIKKSEPVAIIKQPADDSKLQVIKEEKSVAVTVKENKPIKEEKPAVISPKEIKTEVATVPVKQKPQKPDQVVITKPVEEKKEIAKEPAEIKKSEVITSVVASKEKDNQQSKINLPDVSPAAPRAAALIAKRKVTAPQIVFYKSDSLELSLYDNGEVDGDTVSVLLNGVIILAKQGLKASAIKKTIYVPPGTDDSLMLVLYAENLGLYPPNTGLLIVHDGDDVYQVRFSADLQQNAAVIFKRRRN